MEGELRPVCPGYLDIGQERGVWRTMGQTELRKKKDVNTLTEGAPWKLLLLFSLPLMAGNIFQQMYTMVDTAVVGKVLGVDALAALAGTIPYELTCAVSKRVPRVYKRGGETAETSLRLLLQDTGNLSGA